MGVLMALHCGLPTGYPFYNDDDTGVVRIGVFNRETFIESYMHMFCIVS